MSNFHSMGRIGADKSDNSQRNQMNAKFIDHSLANYFNNTNSHVQFATQNHAINFKNSMGGIPGSVIEQDSILLLKSENERPYEKLQLHQRPFATVPYLGRGPGNIDIETKLKHGTSDLEKKSTSTIMDKTFIDYSKYPLLDEVKEKIADPANSIEEVALAGWVRGGIPTRELAHENDKK
tara:strand:+ start:595 stop:1134 length:540 start_codon:yes stop_codon:yes gene_type:complete